MRASQRAEQAELGRVGGCGRRLVRHMMTRFEECEYLPGPPHDRCGKSRQPPHMDAVRPVGPARLEPMQEHDFVPRFAQDRKSTRLNSSHLVISYAVFCLKKKNQKR